MGKEKMMCKKDSTRKIYSKDELNNILSNATGTNMSFFYREPCVVNDTVVNDTGKICYEFITEYLLEHLYLFSSTSIPKVARKSIGNCQYIQESHDGLLSAKQRERIQKDEVVFAMSLLGSELGDLGKVIDYQTPIGDGKFGAVDLLAYNKGVLPLIELKREDSQEPMLRPILEICTYFWQLNKGEELKNELKEKPEYKDIKKVQMAVLVFKNSFQYNQYKNPESTSLRQLVEKLGINIFIFENVKYVENEKYMVTDITQKTTP